MQKSAPSRNDRQETPRLRGRPREFDRDAALSRATCLFWAKGYEATSISDLTKAMGIGSPSLYAAFGSKENLYAEAIRHYGRNYEPLYWGSFDLAPTAREAVRSLLMDSAAALSGCRGEMPHGCMVALSSVGSEGHEELGTLVQMARAVGLDRLKSRFERAVTDGEIADTVDIHALARFVQSVYNGMSILARDGAAREDLEAIGEVALAGWDGWVGRPPQTSAT